jgi:formylglycine-generating enzyme required for sulfatase activity
MIGNVNEWTADPMPPELRYIEGGSYAELNESGLLCENVAGMGEDGRDDFTGFRLAKNLKTGTPR